MHVETVFRLILYQYYLTVIINVLKKPELYTTYINCNVILYKITRTNLGSKAAAGPLLTVQLFLRKYFVELEEEVAKSFK